MEEQNTGIKWHDDTNPDCRAMRQCVYGGAINTERIIEVYCVYPLAARLCYLYEGGGYGDWYLPANGELVLMSENKATIDSTITANGGDPLLVAGYWSSTEHPSDVGKGSNVGMSNGIKYWFPKYSLGHVRAVRVF